MGLFGHYRVFSANKRHGTAAWYWPSDAQLRQDGSVEVRWPAAEDRPFELRAVYRWAAPDTLDLETSVQAKTNLAKFTRMLQGQRDLVTVGKMLLSELSPLVHAQQGVIYQVDADDAASALKLLSSYADGAVGGHASRMQLGEGLIGQCALDGRRILITEMPDSAVPITSGLFQAKPRHVIVLPVLFEVQVKAVIELASLGGFTDLQLTFLEQLTTSIGIVLNSIEATMQTEGLLKQSQQLATELQTQQRELQQTNEKLEQKAQQLADRNVEVEAKGFLRLLQENVQVDDVGPALGEQGGVHA